MQSLCYYCMTPTMVGGKCSVCGKTAADFSTAVDAGILAPGTELDGGSVVVGTRIGRGGFGITYRALDRESGKRVALKEFMPNHLVNRLSDGKSVAVSEGSEDIYLSSRKGFMREARVLNELRRHPNIVKVLFTIEENNTVYYGMEFLEGDNLAVWARKKYPQKPMPAREACSLLVPIMDALDYCHSRGVLHRDISPDNILICTDERGNLNPKLVDFGAAYVAIQDYTHTFPNVRKAYFSPVEQMSGSAKDQGSWSDVYSLGATIYYLITGKPPTSSIDVLTGMGRLQPPSELGVRISEEAEDVLMHGMAMDYRKRIQTIREFRDAFCKALHVDYKEAAYVQTPKSETKKPAPSREEPGKTEPEKPVTEFPEPKWTEEKKTSEPRPAPEPVSSRAEEPPAASGGKAVIRALIYLVLAALCYGFGYYQFGLMGLLYGWIAFSLVLLISLLCSTATPGAAAAGKRFRNRNGDRSNPRMFFYAFLNASPIGLLDVFFLGGKRETLCCSICGLKCVSAAELKKENGESAVSSSAQDQKTEPSPDPFRQGVPSSGTFPKPIPSGSNSAPAPILSGYGEEQRRSYASATMKGTDGPMKGRILSICDGDILGRNPQMAQVVVGGEDATVGRAHCRFVYAKKKGKWGMVNLSSNGIIIDGKKILEKEGTPTVVPDGARVQIGKSTYVFQGNQ